MILLMGMKISFTKKPMKPITINPSAVLMATFENSVPPTTQKRQTDENKASSTASPNLSVLQQSSNTTAITEEEVHKIIINKKTEKQLNPSATTTSALVTDMRPSRTSKPHLTLTHPYQTQITQISQPKPPNSQSVPRRSGLWHRLTSRMLSLAKSFTGRTTVSTASIAPGPVSAKQTRKCKRNRRRLPTSGAVQREIRKHE